MATTPTLITTLTPITTLTLTTTPTPKTTLTLTPILTATKTTTPALITTLTLKTTPTLLTTPTSTTSLTPATTPAGPCPPRWIWRPGTDKCFKSTGYWFDWNSAESLCKVWGSHLASIHTESEQRFIVSLFKVMLPYGANFWIGLKKYENGFIWSDRSPLNYTNWYQGEEASKIINQFSNCVEILDRNGWKWDVRDW